MPDGVLAGHEAALGLAGVPLVERCSRRRLRLVSRPFDVLADRPDARAAAEPASAPGGR